MIAKWNKGKKFLYISLFLLSISSLCSFITGMTGLVIRIVPTLFVYISLITTISAIHHYDRESNRVGLRRMKGFVSIYMVLILVLALRGMYSGHIIRSIYNEFFSFSYILVFMVLGQYEQMWKDLMRILWVPTVVMSILCIISLKYEAYSMTETFIAETSTISGDRWATATLGYQNIRTMELWPLVFVFGFMKQRMSWQTVAALFVFLSFMFLSVWFQKRAPTIRGVAYFVSVLLIMRHIKARWSYLLLPIMFMVIATTCYYLIKSENFVFLLERFQSRDFAEGGGRLYELEEMLLGFNTSDWLFGRGLGGYYLIDNWSAGMKAVNTSGLIGRDIMHIGIFYPLLKGGVLFCVIFYWYAFRLFYFKDQSWRSNIYNLAALAVLPVYLGFLFAEGPASTSNLLNGVLFGLTCGRFVNLRGHSFLVTPCNSGSLRYSTSKSIPLR
jgi:hypothetical protein